MTQLMLACENCDWSEYNTLQFDYVAVCLCAVCSAHCWTMLMCL